MRYVPPFGSSDPDTPYIDGNPQFGIPASCVPAEVFNAVQAEILNVITAVKLDPDRDNLTQLTQAIAQMITDRAVAVDLATTEAAGIVELATLDEAQAGTDTQRAVTPEGLAAALGLYNKVATTTRLGLVKGGGNVAIAADGTLSVATVGSTVITITTSRTWTSPKSGWYLFTVVGAGGGGGAFIGTGGQGGGSYTKLVWLDGGDTVVCAVGAGGIGGTTALGTAGGNTSAALPGGTITGRGGAPGGPSIATAATGGGYSGTGGYGHTGLYGGIGATVTTSPGAYGGGPGGASSLGGGTPSSGNEVKGTNAAANTGGGGGGAGGITVAGGNGGSGVVVIQY